MVVIDTADELNIEGGKRSRTLKIQLALIAASLALPLVAFHRVSWCPIEGRNLKAMLVSRQDLVLQPIT